MQTFIYFFAGLLLILNSAEAALCTSPPCRRCCCPSLCPLLDDVYAKVGYTSAKGIGRQNGYTTLSAFYSGGREESKLLPYADIRLHFFDNNRTAGNFGLGIQKGACDASSLVRGYAFFDFRDTPYRIHKQISLGAEWLGPYFNLAANTYWPIYLKGHRRETEFHFPGHLTINKIRNDYTMRGFDITASRYNPICSWLRIYVSTGLYYYYTNHRSHSTHKSIVGGKFRLEAEMNKGVMVAVQTSYDRQFHSRTYGEISWTFPVGCATPCEMYRALPVRREDIIVLINRTHFSCCH